MKFLAVVEPPEPMRGLEVPPHVVEALGGGARPAVSITVNGHSWRSRVAIMRGRHLIGLSNANRRAAQAEIGDEVEVELTLDSEPRIVVEPDDLATALDMDPAARAAYDALTPPVASANSCARSRERRDLRHGRGASNRRSPRCGADATSTEVDTVPGRDAALRPGTARSCSDQFHHGPFVNGPADRVADAVGLLRGEGAIDRSQITCRTV
nr:YdeI/OmpD-associated family protein [Microbacterium sp. 69-10]